MLNFISLYYDLGAQSGGGLITRNHLTNSSPIDSLSKSNYDSVSLEQYTNVYSPNTMAGIPKFKTSPGGDTGYQYRKNITIQASEVSKDLEYFPVMVKLEDSDLKNKARADGSDIKFTDAAGQLLDYEIELYDPNYSGSQAQLLAWVKIPYLSSTQNTVISMHYGSPYSFVSNEANPEGVWSADYSAVWHLNEAIGNHKDSVNIYDGLRDGNIQTSAKIGNGQTFDGVDDSVIIPAELDLNPPADVSISGWFKLDNDFTSSSTTPVGIFTKYFSNDYDMGIVLADTYYRDHSSIPSGALGIKIENGGSSNIRYHWTNQVSWTAGNWYHFVCLIDADTPTNNKFYVNGADDTANTGGDSTTVDLSYDGDWGIGGGGFDSYQVSAGSAWLDGDLDEFRVATTIRSGGWITTEYKNQNNPSSFISVGSEESLPAPETTENWANPNYKLRKNITIPAENIASDLTNFPLLVELTDQDLYLYGQNNGFDLVFTDYNGNKLPHEIDTYERYDNGKAHVIAWVKTNLSASQDTIISLYFGNSVSQSQADPTGVWDDNFVATWHLAQDPTNDAVVYDSTAFNNHGMTQGTMTSDDWIVGKVGRGYALDGSDDHVIVPHSDSLEITGNQVTLEAWVYIPHLPVPQDCAVIQKAPSDNNERYMLGLDGGNTPTRLNHRVTTNDGHYRYDTGQINQTDWTHIVMKYDGSLGSNPRFFAYINGQLISSNNALGNIASSTADVLLGKRTGGRMYLGWMDELRISDNVRSDVWINTSYNNQNDPATFLSISSTEKIIDEGTPIPELSQFRTLYPSTNTDKHIENDIGTYSNWNAMQQVDNTFNALTEANRISTSPTEFKSPDGYENQQGSWSFEWEMEVSDNDRASSSGTDTDSIDLTNFYIPDLSYTTILGIQVRVEGYAPGSDSLDVALLYNGRSSVSNTDSGSLPDSSDDEDYVYYGGSTSTWGRTWDPADFTNENFGIRISATSASGYSTYVDHVQVRINVEVPSSQVLDREFSFSNVPHDQLDYQLAIKTGTLGSEALEVEGWDDTNAIWESVTTLYDADDNSWVNTSLDRAYTDFRFKDGEYESDSTATSWEIDAVLLKYTLLAKQFTYRKNLTISSTYIAGDLTDFPILIDLYDADLTSKVQSTGNDIIFTNMTGHVLPHEIEIFNQTGNGTHAHLLAWVKIPFLSGSTDTQLSMYYGNMYLSTKEQPEEVWSDYLTVHHLDEDPTGTVKDSTSYNQDMYAVGSMTSDDSVTAIIDRGVDFDGSNDALLSQNQISMASSFSFTYSVWFKLDTLNQWQTLINLDTATSTYRDFAIDDTNQIRMDTYSSNVVFGTLSSTNQWHHAVLTYNGGSYNLNLYINGTQFGTTQSLFLPSITDDFQFGSWGTTDYLNGQMDEIRIAMGVKSSTWIATEFNVQKDPTSLYTIGSEEKVVDTAAPVINNFGVDDKGDGSPQFWADVTDDVFGVASVFLRLDGSDVAMTYNGTYWVYGTTSTYGDSVTYQIWNSTDLIGQSTESPSDQKIKNYNYDTQIPTVIDWEYYPDLGEYGIFKANVSDSYGIIDTVLINVTKVGGTPQNSYVAVMQPIASGYMNDTVILPTLKTIYFVVTVNDTYGNSYTSPEHQSYVSYNTAPEASNLILSPDPVQSNQSLTIDYDYYDFNGDAEGGTQIRWYKNSILQKNLNNTITVGSSYLTKGDQWYATVRPKDERGLFGEINTSSTIIIQNTAPQVTNIVIQPTSPDTTDDLSFSYDYSDYDGDTENTSLIETRWYKGGILQPNLNNTLTLDSSFTSKGEQWIVEVRVSDNSDYSGWRQSSEIIIVNTAPTASNLDLTIETPRTGDDLVATWDYYDADSDPESSNWNIRWYRNGELQTNLNDTKTVGFGNTTKGELWYFTLRVYDGEDYSGTYTLSPSVQIRNTAPTADSLTITSDPQTGDSLALTYNYDDVDGDPEVSTIIRWYKDGVLQSDYNDLISVPSSATSKGEVWNYTLQVYDGSAYSIIYASPQTLIINTAPIAGNLTLTTNPQTLDDLIATWDYYDADGDPENSNWVITWYKDSIEESNLANETVIGSGNTTKGQTWYYTLRVYDSESYSIVYTFTPSVEILNTAPTASNLDLTIETPRTGDDLIATWTYTDVDGDGESTAWVIRWYRNGELQTNLNDTKTVGFGNTTKGELWYFTLRVYDGEDYSGTYTLSPSVQIRNTAPTADSLTITSDPQTGDSLALTYNYDDVDGDPEVSTLIHWYKDGVLQSDYNDLISVPSSATSKGEVWNYTLQVYDGSAYSIIYASPQTLIINTAPTASNLDITPASPRSDDDLVASWDYYDADSDPENSSWNIRWYKDGVLQNSLNDLQTVDSSLITRGELWNYTLQVYDGDNYSILYNSPIVTINNAIPEVINPTFNKTEDINQDDTLEIVYSFYDADSGDSEVDRVIWWFKNGLYNSAFDNETILYADNTTQDEYYYYIITVYDGTEWSNNYTSIIAPIEFVNNIPTLSDVIVTASNNDNLTTHDITGSYTFSDSDEGQEESDREIVWYVSSDNISWTLMDTYNDSITLSSVATSKGQYWKMGIRVSDSIDYSAWYNSTLILILNSNPTASNLAITSNPRNTTDLIASWSYSDPDGDPENTSWLIRWYKDGVYQPTYDDLKTLPAIATSKHQIWNYTLQVYDGAAYSIIYASPQTLIINTAPIAGNLTLTTNPQTLDDLIATWDYYDADLDPENSNWVIKWYRNGVLQPSLTNKTTIGYGNTSKGQFWYYTLRVYDSEVYSILYTLEPSVEILNTAPTASSLNATQNPQTEDDIVASWIFNDVDGDTQNTNWYLQWFKDDIHQIGYDNQTTLPHTATAKGETWYYTLRVYDGSDFSILYTLTPSVQIRNTAPTADSLTITSDPQTGDSLALTYNYDDVDGDPEVSTLIRWYKDGVLQSDYNDLISVPSSATSKGEVWNYTLQVYDGSAYSIIYASPQTLIINTAPIAGNLTLTTNPQTLDDLIATWDYYDADGDPENSNWVIKWYRNGLLQASLTNMTVVGSGNTTKGQIWYYTLQVYDSEVYSLVYTLEDSAEILNTAPTANTLLITSNPQTGDSIEASWIYNDVDGDSESSEWEIRWYKNNVHQPLYDNLKTLPSSATNKLQVWNYTLRVSDGFKLSIFTYNSTTTTVINTKPTVSSPTFTSSPPLYYTTEYIELSYGFEDVDADTLVDYHIIWMVYTTDWEAVTELENQTLVNPSFTIKDQQWRYNISVFDGTDWSDYYTVGNTAFIINSEPEISNIKIYGGINTDTDIWVVYDFYDADNDTESGTTFEWEIIDSGSVETISNGINETLPSSYTEAGNLIRCSIVPSDGAATGDSTNSPYLSVGNTAPVIDNGPYIINPAGDNTSFVSFTDIYVYYNASDRDGDLDQAPGSIYDIETSKLVTTAGTTLWLVSDTEYRWYRNGKLVTALNDQTVVPSSYLQPGQNWFISIRPYDRYGTPGNWSVASFNVTIQNTAPEVTGVTWNNIHPTSTNNLELITWGYGDSDGDIEIESRVKIRWFINGIEKSGYENDTLILASEYVRGDQIHILITVYDGTDFSTEYNSTSFSNGLITVVNAKPSVLSRGNINGYNVTYTTDNLVLAYNYTDPELDPEFTNLRLVRWYLNGEYQAQFDNQTVISSTHVNYGQTWYVVFWVHDGFSYSNAITTYSLTVQNTVIQLLSVELNEGDTSIFTNDTIFVDIVFNDPDGELIQSDEIIWWYRNGEYVSAFDNQTVISSNVINKTEMWYCVYRIMDSAGAWSSNRSSQSIFIENWVPFIPEDSVEFIFSDPELDDQRSFFIEDEDLTISYNLIELDNDSDQALIQWYMNDTHVPSLDGFIVVPQAMTNPGENWTVRITPHDGQTSGITRISPSVRIESRPNIYHIGAEPQIEVENTVYDEGVYDIVVVSNNSLRDIYQVKYVITVEYLNYTLPDIYETSINGTTDVWVHDDFDLITILRQQGYGASDFVMLMGTNVTVDITSTVRLVENGRTHFIESSKLFSFTIEDHAPPRVVNAYFEWNDDLKPTNITFYATIEDFGSGIDEVILFYHFRAIGEVNQTSTTERLGYRIRLYQLNPDEIPYNTTTMAFNGAQYAATIQFKPKTNYEVYFDVGVTDATGNTNLRGWPQGSDEQNVREGRFIYSVVEGLPLELLALIIVILIVISAVAIRRFSTTELVGLDIDKVLEGTITVDPAEIEANLDEYTLGIVVSYFDQKHGPIPIFVEPPILKDNFNKLLELADLSFSAVRFVDNPVDELPSNFDFTIGPEIRITSIAFGFALNRPSARGGLENITFNILAHKEYSQLLIKFQEELVDPIHEIHVLMDESPDEKDEISSKIKKLRRKVTSIIIAYEKMYGPVEEADLEDLDKSSE